jgi:hypothetical protein
VEYNALFASALLGATCEGRNMTELIVPPRRLEALFAELTEQWKRETRLLSSTSAIAMHPSYQRIIGLGPQVVPLILAEMQREPGHWFWALAALTGENPVPPADRGRVAPMTDAWLKWGRENGWIA